EPYVAKGVQQGLFVKWIAQSNYNILQTGFIIFGQKMVEDRDLAERWLTAYLKGTRAYLDAFGPKRINRDEAVSIMTKYTVDKDPKLYDIMEMPYFDPNGVPDKKSMDAVYKWFVAQGLYKGKTTFDDLLDLSFVNNAAQKLGKQ
ncbi:MAG: hypothetical protein Q8O76_08800, partial [Chloroflexota bacterium]|nr:hypothetical protein [Chloroflexota bacterium]